MVQAVDQTFPIIPKGVATLHRTCSISIRSHPENKGKDYG